MALQHVLVLEVLEVGIFVLLPNMRRCVNMETSDALIPVSGVGTDTGVEYWTRTDTTTRLPVVLRIFDNFVNCF